MTYDPETRPGAQDSKTLPNSPTPDNLHDNIVPDDTGFLVVRFKPNTITGDDIDLEKAAREAGRVHIAELLKSLNLAGTRVFASITPEQLRKLEEETANHEFAPVHSLLSYWRIDARQADKALGVIEAALRVFPEVDLVYRDKTISDPLTPANDLYSGQQKFLNERALGVDARWMWSLPSGHGVGQGMHFIDIEQEWILNHEDLPTPRLIFNDNHNGADGFDGNHGTGVVGIVAGVDNDRGVIGVAPKVESVRVVSHWNRTTRISNLPEAIGKAITLPPLPHVLLIEAQRGADRLPPETDDAVFNAIRTAVAKGVIVVETAGNGNQFLDFLPRLNRKSPGFTAADDSGAIMVGAATSSVPHERSIWGSQGSNFGSRIDCHAWGDGIVTCGNGSLAGSGINSYARNFGGTSGAAAIIAGCALLLQGLHFAQNKPLLSPSAMRRMLSDPNTGIAPGIKVGGDIGFMPDLRAIVKQAKLSPNIITRILNLRILQRITTRARNLVRVSMSR